MDPQHLGGVERLAVGDVKDGRSQKGQNERDEQDEHEADVLGEVVVDLSALLDGINDGGEVVVGEDHAPSVLRHVGTATHGDADVCRFDRRGVVDPVAGHGHHSPLFLEIVGKQHFVFGGHPAHHPDAVYTSQSLTLRESGEVGPQDGVARDPELGGDGRSGGDIVAGYHTYPYVSG